MNGEYIVLSILKENGVTIGAKVTDGERIVKMYTNSLAKRYKEGYRFKNAILTSDGFVKSRKGYDRLSVEEVSSSKIIVYHASAKGIQGKISATKSKGRNDFGNGFYLGEYKEQTLNRICNEKNWIGLFSGVNVDGIPDIQVVEDILKRDTDLIYEPNEIAYWL